MRPNNDFSFSPRVSSPPLCGFDGCAGKTIRVRPRVSHQHHSRAGVQHLRQADRQRSVCDALSSVSCFIIWTIAALITIELSVGKCLADGFSDV